MSGKNFITVCKWICGGWAFCSCTLLMGQVVARPLPDSKVVGRPVNGAIHHKINPPTGTPDGGGHEPRIRMDQAYGKLPLSFEPNLGQANSQVQFLSRGEGYTLFLTGDAAVLALHANKRKVEIQKPKIEKRQLSVVTSPLQGSIDHGPRTTDAVLRIKMVGANPTAKVYGLDELRGKTNYFIGKDPKNWRTNVPNYAKVRFEGVYPGVDLVYYGNQRHLEYDFILAPRADLNVITLAMETGNRKLETGKWKLSTRIAANGDLVINAAGGEVRFQKPVVYQEESSVVSGQLSVERSFASLRMTSNDGLLTTDNEPLTANHKSQITNSWTGVTFSRRIIN
jgi:hypothetical protein